MLANISEVDKRSFSVAMTIITKKIVGAFLLLLASLLGIAVVINNHTQKQGGLDLRPLLGTSLFFAVAAFGLMIEAKWAKLLSSLLLAIYGIWMAVRDTFIYKLPDPLVGILFGILLCLPLIFTLRTQATTVAT